MKLEFRPVQIAVEGQDAGRLVFCGDRLVAVLTRLSEEAGEDRGKWFLEAGFDGLEGPDQPIFADLEEAGAWITARLPPVLPGG